MRFETVLFHLLIQQLHKKINKYRKMALELGFNNTLHTADLDGNTKVLHGLPNRHDNCWLNSMMQLANWVGDGFFRNTYDNPDLIPQTIKFLSDYTGIDLSYGGPPSIVFYKIKDLLDKEVGTSKCPGDYVVSCAGAYCLADMQAGVFMQGGEHAVFYACTALGWIKIDDELITREIPDPANVLVFNPWDKSEICDYNEDVFSALYLRGAGTSKPQVGNSNESGNSGSIVNNYYMQQYQNSIDATVGDKPVTGGHGLGDTAGSATNNTSNQQQPKPENDWFGSFLQGIGGALPGAALGLLLDKKTEETTKLEDRIVTTRVGTDNHTTQSSVGIMHGYSFVQDQDEIHAASGTHSDASHSQKYYTTKLFDWSASDGVGLTYKLPLPRGMFGKLGVYERVIKEYALARNGWEIHVQVTGSLYHSGCLIVAMVPEESATIISKDGAFNAEFAQLPVFPHQYINLRTNTTASLRVPYVGAADMDDYRKHNPWTLVVGIVSPLKTGNHDLNSIQVRLTIAPLSVKVAGPLPQTQGLIPVATKAGSTGFSTTTPLTADPVYGLVSNPPRRRIPGRFKNFLDVADHCPTMARFTDKPTVTTQMTAENLLFTMDVSLASHELSYTYLAGLSQLFAQYRGSLNIHFVYTGPADQKARFMIVFVPSGASHPTRLVDATHCVTAEWDTGLNSEYIFNVPYVSQSYYTTTHSARADVTTVSGWVQLWQITAATSIHEVLVLFSSGRDFELRCPIELVKQTTDVGETGLGLDLDARQQGGHYRRPFRQHTDVEFLLDRFSIMALQTGSNSKVHAKSQYFEIDPTRVAFDTLITTLLKGATYYFADIEVAVVARGPVGEYGHVTWYPVGTPVDHDRDDHPDTSTDTLGLNSSVSVGFQGPSGTGSVAQMALPYTATWRVLPTKYTGDTAHEIVNSNTFSGGGFGAIVVVGPPTVGFRIMYRLKRTELYCPRPLISRLNPGELTHRSKMDLVGIEKQLNKELLMLAGDVESNPGPTSFSRSLGDLSRLAGSMESIATSLGDFRDMLKGAGPWYKAFKYLWKLASIVVAAIRTKDPVVIGMMLADLGIEIFDTKVAVQALADKLQPHFNTVAPKFEFATSFARKVASIFDDPEDECEEFDDTNPFKQFKIRDLNDIFSALKNGEWLVKLLVAVRDWIKAWLTSEEKFVSYHDLVPQILQHQENLAKPDLYDTSVMWLAKTQSTLLKAGQHALARLCEPKLSKPAETRPEPVVVLLRGKSGQGKSFISNILATALSKLITGRPDSVWSCPPDPDFFDGYRQQAVVIMDDLGQNPSGNDFKYFAQMVSTTAFVPPMAALEDKGKAFTSPVIIATTNTHEHFTPVTMSCPEALKRRFAFDYTLTAKMVKRGGTLDVRRALQKTGESLNEIFENNCPLLDGKAVTFTAIRDTPPVDSVYELLEEVYAAVVERKDVANIRVIKQTGVTLACDQQVCPDDETAERVLRFLVTTGNVDAAKKFWEEACSDKIKIKWKDTMGKYLEVRSAWNKLKRHAELFLAGLLLVGNLVTLYLCSRVGDQDTKQGPYGGKPAKPVVGEKTKVNPLVMTETGHPPTDLQQMVLNNTKPVTLVRDGQSVAVCCALGVFGNTYLVPNHLFEESFDAIQIGERLVKPSEYTVQQFEFPDGRVSDCAALTLYKGPRVRDIVSHFRDEVKVPKGTPVVGCVRNTDVGQLVFSGTSLSFRNEVLCSDGDSLPVMFAYKANTRYGYCGAGVLTKDGAHTVILGIHSAGGNGIGYASCITRSVLLGLRAKMNPSLEGLLLAESTGPKVHVSRKSRLAPTMAHGVFKPAYGPAALSNNDTRLNPGVVLDETIFSKHTQDKELSPDDLALFKLCAAEYASHLHSVLGNTSEPLTVQEAIMGTVGLDGMEPDTAPGLPWALQNKRRTDLVNFSEGTVGPEVAACLRQMDEGKYTFECQTFLKDEIRPLEKVRAGKTRIVDVLPVEHIIYSRQHLGRFCAAMHRNCGPIIGSAVGCDPDIAWQEFGTHFSQFKNVWAIDYSAFDSCHSTQLLNTMADEVFSDAYGFGENARWCIKSLACTTHAYEDKRYVISGGLPSGCSATSILNTVLNNIYVLYALRRTYPAVDLHDYSMIAYGDDVVLASDHDFDLNLVKKSFSSLGHTVTPEDKSDRGFVLGMKITDVSFLKRKFEVDSALGLYKPVMDSKVLEAILSFARRGTLQEKLVSVAGLAVHSGETEYNRLMEPFRGLFDIPSHRFLRLRWVHKVCQ